MNTQIRKAVCKVNQALVEKKLVKFTFGNASVFDPDTGRVFIKPSGVPFDQLTPENMVVMNLDGECHHVDLRPSSDYPTHLEIYKCFEGVTAVIHTHSKWATAWAQAKRCIPVLGTTHADYFNGDIPCTGDMDKESIQEDYEKNTGRYICNRIQSLNINPLEIPACLVASHGPFVWGESLEQALMNAEILEDIAEMAFHSVVLGRDSAIPDFLLKKHYERKHGQNAYYGQKNKIDAREI